MFPLIASSRCGNGLIVRRLLSPPGSRPRRTSIGTVSRRCRAPPDASDNSGKWSRASVVVENQRWSKTAETKAVFPRHRAETGTTL